MEPQAGTRPERSTLDQFLGRQPSSKRMRQLRRAAPVVGLLLLAGLAALYFTGRSSDQPSYATTPVQRGDLRVTVSATGNLQPTNEVEVGSELSGLVTEVNVDNNDRVKKGQVLARIDTARLQDSIAQSRASLQSAIASVAQAEATAQQAKASLARFEEVHKLSGGKVPSAAEFDTARAEYARAVAGVRTAEAGVAQARAQLSSDQTQFSKALILSPVTGVVLSRQIDPGQTVAASFNAPVLFLIAEDLSEMRLEAAIRLLKRSGCEVNSHAVQALIVGYETRANQMQAAGAAGEGKRMARRAAALNGLLVHGPGRRNLSHHLPMEEGWSRCSGRDYCRPLLAQRLLHRLWQLRPLGHQCRRIHEHGRGHREPDRPRAHAAAPGAARAGARAKGDP